MDNESDREQQQETRPYVVTPPIFSLFQLLQKQPMFLGAILGAVLGLVVATSFEIRVSTAVIGGAVVGFVVATIIVRLR